jgi:hypothetical protein
MGTHDGGIAEDLGGQLTAVLLHVLPEFLPEVTSVPATKAVIDRVPVAKVVREIAPGDAGTRLIEHRFNEHPVTERRGTAGVVLQGPHNGLYLSPHGIGDDKTECQSYSPQGLMFGE